MVSLASFLHESHLYKELCTFDYGEVQVGLNKRVEYKVACHGLDKSIRSAGQSLLDFERFVDCLSGNVQFGRVAIYQGTTLSIDGRLKDIVMELAVLFATSTQVAHDILLLGRTLSP